MIDTSAKYLIWLNEKRGWLGPRACGTMGVASHAGRYSLREAEAFCETANRHLEPRREPSAVLFLAPEALQIDRIETFSGGSSLAAASPGP
jgi:hypothetical protein